MTKDEIIDRVARRLEARNHRANWGTIISAINSASESERAAIVDDISNDRYLNIGKRLARLVRAYRTSDAKSQAAQMLADDSLDLVQLEQIL